jgi:putative flippase GtrA
MIAKLRAFAAHPTFQQFIKFAIVGFGGFAVDFLMLTFAIEVLRLGHYTAAFFSFPFALCATWLGNRSFTFRGKAQHGWQQELMRFIAVCIVGLIINRGTYSAVITLIPFAYSHPTLGLMVGTVAGMVFNFFLSKRHVFG